MKKIYLLLSFAVSLIITANAQFKGEQAILVVGTAPGNEAEKAIEQRLIGMGLDVVVSSGIKEADMADVDLLMISGTVNSGDVTGALPSMASYEIPIINGEPALQDDLGFSTQGGSGIDAVDGNIEIVDSEHPMAAELEGTVTITTGTKYISSGEPEGEAIIVAVSLANDKLAVIFGYEKGTLMAADSVAPARRVGFFLMNDAADAMTEDGWLLFDASVEWAMGELPDFVIDNQAHTVEMSVYPNPTSGIFELSFVSDYPQMVEINISNVMGQKVLSTTFQANNGMNNLKLDASELNKGLYYYSVSINNRIASGKILITE